MKNHLIKLCTLALLSASVFSCKKDYGVNLGPVEDSVTDIPVTVTNANAFERFPVVNTSIAGGGNISITLAIPADKGIIKQITKVATSSTFQALSYTNINATTVSSAFNTTGTGTSLAQAPIPGNGTNTITFNTTLGPRAMDPAGTPNYLAYRNRVGATAGPIGPPATMGGPATIPVPSTTTVPTDIAFYFRIELEGSSPVEQRTIIALPVRVRVLP